MKIKILAVALACLTVGSIGFFILKLDLPVNENGEVLVKLGKGLFYGFCALAIVFFLLYIFPKTISAWKKFAVWFVPLATLIFLIYPEPSSGDLLAPYPEQVFRWISGLYVAISAAIIARSHFAKK